mgnify:CR=1 FL=1
MIIKAIIVAIVLAFTVISIKVDSNNSLFVDQFGRYRVYHGVNAVYKTHPFHPNIVDFSTNYSLTDHDLLNLKNWGMNVIRLHAAWEGPAPQKGVYNYSYDPPRSVGGTRTAKGSLQLFLRRNPPPNCAQVRQVRHRCAPRRASGPFRKAVLRRRTACLGGQARDLPRSANCKD